MRGVLRKWTSRDKYFKYRLSLFLECFGEIGRKLVKSRYPINSLKVIAFLPILAQVRKQLAPRQRIITPPETANQWDNGTSWRHWRWIKISRVKQPIANSFSFFSVTAVSLLVEYATFGFATCSLPTYMPNSLLTLSYHSIYFHDLLELTSCFKEVFLT